MEAIETHIGPLLIGLYLIITFLFSIVEKLTNWKQTIDFYTNHFNGSFIQNRIRFWVSMVILLEIITCTLLCLGVYLLLISFNFVILKYGFIASAMTFIFLLVGQRIAKDYVGATSLTVYFILSVFGIYLLN